MSTLTLYEVMFKGCLFTVEARDADEAIYEAECMHHDNPGLYECFDAPGDAYVSCAFAQDNF